MSDQNLYSEPVSLMKTINNQTASNDSTIIAQINEIVKNSISSPKEKPMNIQKVIPTNQYKAIDTKKKAKRKNNRFKGVTEEELMTRFLPDHIKHGLDILIIGINPGLFSVYKGHHYVGPGNHFWKCLYLAGLIPLPLTGMEDYKALDFGVGFTNIVRRTTPGSKDLSSLEIREGGKDLIERIKKYRPKIAVFNGKGIYEIFSKEMFGQKKKDFTFGKQSNTIPGTDTFIFVMPSSSARCSQFPRAQDKVHFFIQIKKLRDQLKGVQSNSEVVETNYSFDLHKATEMCRLENVKQEIHDPAYDEGQGMTPSSSLAVATTSSPLPTKLSHSGQVPAHAEVARKPGLLQGRKGYSGGAAAHPNLVKCLCQNDDDAPDPAPPLVRPPVMSNLNEVVSEEQKNERVGMWIRTQINQDYESDPPMGYEERQREFENTEQPESDHGSHQSMISAGVSGSLSTSSTSGYGSMDNNIHSQDRVELWVREQYVRHLNAPTGARKTLQPQLLYEEAGENRAHRGPLASGPSHEPYNNLAMHQLLFPGTLPGTNAMDGGYRPPVPLYSTWGGNEADHFSALAANLNSNSVIQPQFNINSFIP